MITKISGGKVITKRITEDANKSAPKAENKIIITIYADGKSIEEIINELMPKLKLALANL